MVTAQGLSTLFRFLSPYAHAVFLVGDFNHWAAADLPMQHSADGFWTATLDLPPGEYRFRYFADAQWFVDYAAFGVEQGPFGLDSVARVPKPAMPAACTECPYSSPQASRRGVKAAA